MTKTHTIDATDKVLGRTCSEVAKILMGKNETDYVANKVADVIVNIINVSKTKTSDKKEKETIHTHYTGYPGGLRKESNAKIIEKKGWTELYILAIRGMLPNNKLRPLMMKRLIIKE